MKISEYSIQENRERESNKENQRSKKKEGNYKYEQKLITPIFRRGFKKQNLWKNQ